MSTFTTIIVLLITSIVGLFSLLFMLIYRRVFNSRMKMTEEEEMKREVEYRRNRDRHYMRD